MTKQYTNPHLLKWQDLTAEQRQDATALWSTHADQYDWWEQLARHIRPDMTFEQWDYAWQYCNMTVGHWNYAKSELMLALNGTF